MQESSSGHKKLKIVYLKYMEETLQETANRLKNFPGNVKGEVFRTHADYIRQKEGEEGVIRVEEKMTELGAPILFEEIKSFEWISEGMSSLTIVVAREVFNWTKEDVFEMGRFAPKFSFIIKVMIQYLVSIEALLKNAEKYWDKHFDFGSIEVSFNIEEKKATIIEKGINTHPLTCVYHTGYFKGLCEFAIKSKNISVEETACVHEGAEYNEFVITWD
jgi:predicted hydrocarbon binding protein